MVKCAVSVLKLAIAVLLSARNTIMTTVNAALRPAVVVLRLVVRWLQQWQHN